MMEGRRSTIVSLILLLAVALAMFADLLFAGGTRVLGHPGSDMFLQYFAWREFGFRELAKGNFALWNPHIFSGAPYFGGMQGALLYPPIGLCTRVSGSSRTSTWEADATARGREQPPASDPQTVRPGRPSRSSRG